MANNYKTITSNDKRIKSFIYLAFFSILSLFFFLSHQWFAPTTEDESLSVTLPLPKGNTSADFSNKSQNITWHSLVVQPGMNFTTIFQKLGFSLQSLHEILASDPSTINLRNLKPDTKIDYAIDEQNNLIQMEYPLSHTQILKITRDGEHYHTKIIQAQIEKRIHYSTMTIKTSLSAAGLKAGLSENTILQIASMLAWDIDFTKDIKPEDTFTVIHEDHYSGDAKIRTGHVLAVRFTNSQNKTFEVIRFVHPDGSTGYYRSDGSSMRAAFLRSPVKFTRISSRYNLRRHHPILHSIRQHNGIDFAAPIGTEVKASGNGTIKFIGKKGGYGRVIEIQHANKYSTVYAHLSGFAQNLRIGHKVKQGELIGYVGKSGLATGPHLHYEFRVNGKHVNPEIVNIPREQALTGELKKMFLAYAKPLLAQLDLYQNAQLISNSSSIQVS